MGGNMSGFSDYPIDTVLKRKRNGQKYRVIEHLLENVQRWGGEWVRIERVSDGSVLTVRTDMIPEWASVESKPEMESIK